MSKMGTPDIEVVIRVTAGPKRYSTRVPRLL